MKNRVVLVAGVALVAVVAVILLFANQPAPVSGAVELITAERYVQSISSAEHFLLDVRTPEEFSSERIAGAVNISVQTLPDRLSEVPRDQPIVVYCRSGNRSATAARLLAEAGFTNIYDMGGIIAWQAAGQPVER